MATSTKAHSPPRVALFECRWAGQLGQFSDLRLFKLPRRHDKKQNKKNNNPKQLEWLHTHSSSAALADCVVCNTGFIADGIVTFENDFGLFAMNKCKKKHLPVLTLVCVSSQCFSRTPEAPRLAGDSARPSSEVEVLPVARAASRQHMTERGPDYPPSHQLFNEHRDLFLWK